MKKLLLLLSLFFLVGCTQKIGVDPRVFTSSQVGRDPQNGYILSTNGTSSTWIANSGGPGGGSTTTLTATEVAYGDSNNLVTSSPNFTFNSSTNQLAVTNVTSSNITSTILYASNAVGIGTTPNASSYALDIEMGSRDVRFKGSSIFGNGFFTENSTSNQQWALGSAGSSGILGPSGAFYFYDNTSSSLSLVLTKTGLLGLGVTSPGSRVSLAASTTATGGIAFGTDTNLYRSAASSLTTDDHLYAASTTVSGGFFQTGMLDCDDPTTSKLLYDVTTGKYSCGTDQTGGGSGGGSNWQVDGNGDLTPTTTIDIALPAGLSVVGHTQFTSATGTSVTTTNLGLNGFSNGSLLFTTSSGNVTQSNSGLYFDSVNNRLGINTTTVGTTLMVDGDSEIMNDLVVGRGLSSAGWQTGLSIYAFGGERPAIAKNNTTGKIGYLASGGTQGLELITAARSVLINTRSEGGTTEFTTGGTITSYTNAALDIVGTWNNSTTRFWAIRSNFTDTGSNATTSLIDLMVGSVTKFNVQKNGWVSIATSTPIAALTLNASTTATGGLAFGTDTNLYRSAADSLKTDDHFYAASTTIAGGFFQTGMSTCNADNETLGYNATTGKFECGDDDTTVSVVSTTNANTRGFTDISPATMVDNNTTEIFNDTTRPNIQPQSVNNSVLVTLDFQLRGGGTSDADAAVRVVRENDPGSTTPTCDLTSDAQVGSSIVGGSLATAFFTNTTDIQTARLSVVDSPATTSPVYYTICSSASSTLTSVPVSLALHVSLTEIQGSGGGTSREYTHIVTSTGSSAWTKPATSTGFIGVRVWTVGGGGGGGGSGTAGNIGAGGGGAGSGYKTIMAASLSATTSVTVGAAGTAGAAGNNDGVAGGTSSFGSHISCTGGGGGNDGGSGGGGGAAGTCTGADLSGSGIAGQSSGAYTDSYRGYGGSAGVDQGFPLSEPSDALSRIIPAGGLLGMYAGAGATRPPSWDANSRTGGSGAYFGAGGSGGQEVGAGGDVAGGAGKQGVVVIQELYQ